MVTVEEIQKEATELNEKYQKSQAGEFRAVWRCVAMAALDSSIQQINVTVNENTSVKKVLMGLMAWPVGTGRNEGGTEGLQVGRSGADTCGPIGGPEQCGEPIEASATATVWKGKRTLSCRDDLAEKAKKESDNYKSIEDAVRVGGMGWECSSSSCSRRRRCFRWRTFLSKSSDCDCWRKWGWVFWLFVTIG